METVLQIIQTLGFPIACVIGLGYYTIHKDKEHKKERDEWRSDEKDQREKENESLEKLISSVNENTISLKLLYERIVTKENT